MGTFPKSSLWGFIRAFLTGRSNGNGEHQPPKDDFHLEPRYWPEVKHFMARINDIVDSNTIEDQNVHVVNQRIIDYVESQINKKGSMHDIEERYMALSTLADRVLINNLSKIVGMKQVDSTHADFSNAVHDFKEALAARRAQEKDYEKQHSKH